MMGSLPDFGVQICGVWGQIQGWNWSKSVVGHGLVDLMWVWIVVVAVSGEEGATENLWRGFFEFCLNWARLNFRPSPLPSSCRANRQLVHC